MAYTTMLKHIELVSIVARDLVFFARGEGVGGTLSQSLSQSQRNLNALKSFFPHLWFELTFLLQTIPSFIIKVQQCIFTYQEKPGKSSTHPNLTAEQSSQSA